MSKDSQNVMLEILEEFIRKEIILTTYTFIFSSKSFFFFNNMKMYLKKISI